MGDFVFRLILRPTFPYLLPTVSKLFGVGVGVGLGVGVGVTGVPEFKAVRIATIADAIPATTGP